MSDPFENIDNEVYIEKIKNFFYKYKIIIVTTIIAFILSVLGLTVLNNYKNREVDKISNYYIKILSIIESDPKRAEIELKKLAKLKNKDYRNLSNLLLFKLQFQNNEFEESLSFGGMWALLGHELRGHFQFANKDYENALKNFSKIIQNQQSTASIRNRAQEMIDNINLYYDKNN